MNKNKQNFLNEVAALRKKYPGDYECEWCGMRYPPGEYEYKKLKCRNVLVPHDKLKPHIICKDCYDRLETI